MDCVQIHGNGDVAKLLAEYKLPYKKALRIFNALLTPRFDGKVRKIIIAADNQWSLIRMDKVCLPPNGLDLLKALLEKNPNLRGSINVVPPNCSGVMSIICKVKGRSLISSLLNLIPTAISIIYSDLFVQHQLNEEEKTLIAALMKNDSNTVSDALGILEERNKPLYERVYERGVRASITNVFDKITENKISKIEHAISLQEDRIKDLLKALSDASAEAEELKERLLVQRDSLVNKKQAEDLADYILSSNSITNFEANDDAFTFDVFGHIKYFDRDVAERLINNENSYIYNRPHRNVSEFKMLLNELFVSESPEIELNVYASFKLTLTNGLMIEERVTMDASQTNYIGDVCYAPNPHIMKFHCFGGYARLFADAISKNNLFMLLEQVVASTLSLNISDSTVFGYLLDWLRSYGEVIHIISEDRYVDIKDAIAWLKERRKIEGGRNE